MKKTLIAGFLAIYLSQSTALAGPFEAVTYPALPDWAQDSLYDGTYLNVDQVMKLEGLNRFEAIELQNQFKDLIQAKISKQEAYDQALAKVHAGQFESGWRPVTFKAPGDFVAVLDLDETLLHQWYKSGQDGNFDLQTSVSDTNGRDLVSPLSIKFTPGAEQFILSLERNPHNKGVVVFSAKLDQAALDLLSKWKFSDGSLARSHFAGVFTRNFLVVGPKVTTPSKDLRIFDPDLKHVVMVDDNPGRIFQGQNLRAEPKFDADAHLKAKTSGSAEVTLHYESALQNALSEIEESAQAAETLSVPFSQAFLPYSYSGGRIYQSLLKTLSSKQKALEVTRKNPELQEAVFFSAGKKPE